LKKDPRTGQCGQIIKHRSFLKEIEMRNSPQYFPDYALVYSMRKKEMVRIGKAALQKAIAKKKSLWLFAYENFSSGPVVLGLCKRWKLDYKFRGYCSTKGIPRGFRGAYTHKKKYKRRTNKVSTKSNGTWSKRLIHIHEPTQTKVLESGSAFRVEKKGGRWLGSFPRLADAMSFVENASKN